MQLIDIQNSLRGQNVFKRKKTKATSREKNATIMILQDTSHRNVRNKRNHKVSLLLNEASEI